MFNKKIVSALLTIIMTFGMCSVAFAAGDISEDYTPVYSAEDLDNIRNNLSGKYILMNHISLSDYTEWNPIGDFEAPFTGELNGDGYSITGFKSDDSLLGRTENATVKNLGVVDCAVVQPEETASNSTALGAFASHSISSVYENCFVTGKINPRISVGMMTVMSSCSAGGLVGVARDSSFINCYNNADINLTYDSVNIAKIGGLAGESHNTSFECCYNTGVISFENVDKVRSVNTHEGGLVGSADGDTSFNYCYFKDDFNYAVGKEKNNPEGTKILTGSQMKNKEEFVGFDFINVWDIKNEYPLLRTNNVLISKEIDLYYKNSCSIFENENKKIVSWESSDEKVAIVNEDGKIVGVGVGSATVFVETESGESASITVNVTYAVWQMFIVYFLFGWMWY